MKILVSPGFGAGWSTWVLDSPFKRTALTWQPLIEFIEAGGDLRQVDEEHPALAGLVEIYPDLYLGGLRELRVVDLPTGTVFRVNQYDGSESIDYGDGFMVAD